jgi:hypothetical protein
VGVKAAALAVVPTLLALGTCGPALAQAQAQGAPAQPDVGSSFTPALPRGMTRLYGTVRPFLSLLGNGGGAIMDLHVDHYLARLPLRLSLELAPLAVAVEGDGAGAIGHLRLGAAYATDYIEIGASLGGRLQNFGASGLSMASSLRLGALDGLKLQLSYGYTLERNRWNGLPVIGMSNMVASFDVPLSRRVALFTEAGASADLWVYWSAGLRYRLTGEGGAGTWVVSGSFGLGWVIDRPACPYPETGWCTESGWALGPTMGFGLERRF